VHVIPDAVALQTATGTGALSGEYALRFASHPELGQSRCIRWDASPSDIELSLQAIVGIANPSVSIPSFDAGDATGKSGFRFNVTFRPGQFQTSMQIGNFPMLEAVLGQVAGCNSWLPYSADHAVAVYPLQDGISAFVPAVVNFETTHSDSNLA